MRKSFLKRGHLILLLATALVLFSVSQVYATDPLDIEISVGGTINDTIGTGPSTEDGAKIVVTAQNNITVAQKSFISISDHGTIDIKDNVPIDVINLDSSNPGLYGNGPSGIEARSNNTITLGQESSFTFTNLFGTKGAAIRLMGTQNIVTNNGMIKAEGGSAIDAMGVNNIIINAGSISATGNYAVALNGSNNFIINSGTISGDTGAIWFENNTTEINTIHNSGTIFSNGISIGSDSGGVNLTNTENGTIIGAILFVKGDNTITLHANSNRASASIIGDILSMG